MAAATCQSGAMNISSTSGDGDMQGWAQACRPHRGGEQHQAVVIQCIGEPDEQQQQRRAPQRRRQQPRHRRRQALPHLQRRSRTARRGAVGMLGASGTLAALLHAGNKGL